MLAAEDADPNAHHSVISWIGYDAPNVPEAALEGRAEGAVNELSGFQDGLRATHQGPPSNNTVIGHSYGSTVVGHTAQSQQGLDADELVVVGSPGMNADHVSDLHMPAEDMHASTAQNDRINKGWFGAGSEAAHGTDPTQESFGATPFPSNPGTAGGNWPLGEARSEYFNDETTSLACTGEVIAGQR